MSRIGKKIIPIPEGVKVSIKSGSIELTGPQGTVQQPFPSVISVECDEANKLIRVTRPDDEKQSKSLHGLVRALVANAVVGVTKGYKKSLDVVGGGYNAKLKGKQLELQVGYSLPRTLMIPEGLVVEAPTPLKIIIKGCDKHLVGQFAANVRAVRPPDSYKGKGIRYEGEVIKIKAGKTFAGAS